jgi:hypothetical protein
MLFETLSLAALILVSFTSLILLLVQYWHWSLIVIFVQYIGVFILVGLSWPVQMAVAKLLAGGICVAVLWLAEIGLVQQANVDGISLPLASQPVDQLPLSGFLFRLFAAIMVGLVVFSIRSVILDWIPELNTAQAFSSLILIGLGLLHLGLTTRPLGVILGLLTVLCGFEILYAGVEVSALVEGLLAAVNLGLALTGAYLILAPGMEESP